MQIPEVIFYGKSCHVVITEKGRFFYSYTTLVGFSGFLNGELVHYRTKENWSRTTSRHMSLMGCNVYEKVPHNELIELIENSDTLAKAA